jgi:cytochrome P450
MIQRNPEFSGADVDEFIPERWEKWVPAPWTYVPFNGGPRICLGQNFALTEMAYATARMCQTFARVEERSVMPRGSQGYKTDIILTPLLGVKIGLILAEPTEF